MKNKLYKMKYTILQPDHELTIGYFTLFLKYITLVVASWIFGWLILLFIPFKSGNSYNGRGEDVINNPQLVSYILIVLVVCFYTYSVYMKSKYGVIKEMEFKELETRFVTVHLISGKNEEFVVSNERLKVVFHEKHHVLYGKQREFEINDKYTLKAKLNVDMTAWVRHPEIQEILEKLEKFK